MLYVKNYSDKPRRKLHNNKLSSDSQEGWTEAPPQLKTNFNVLNIYAIPLSKNIKKMKNKFRYVFSSLCLLALVSNAVFSQQPPPLPPIAEDNTWWYVTLFILVISLSGAVFWMLKTKKAEKEAQSEALKREKQLKSAKGRDFIWKLIEATG